MKKETYRHLSLLDREQIAEYFRGGWSIRSIAQHLDRSASTISREIKRNSCQAAGLYLPYSAQARADNRGQVPRSPRKLLNDGLWREVIAGLRKRWSPEQIAGDLKERHPAEPERQVSHETIYVGLYLLPRGELRKELLLYLRQSHKQRRPRSRGSDRRGQIPNMVCIGERPLEVESRLIPGHWEGDLIKGAGNRSAVATLVERHSRYVMLVHVENASAEAVCKGLARRFRQMPAALRKTLTYDRGKEMAQHEKLAAQTKMKIYFADPHSPWQRGSNENTNGLLRQYLPKGMDLSEVSQVELNRIAHQLNTRPRKIHGWSTPEKIWGKATNVALGT